jgi:hypothetical protein
MFAGRKPQTSYAIDIKDALRGFAPLPLGKLRSVFHGRVCKTTEYPYKMEEISIEKVAVQVLNIIFKTKKQTNYNLCKEKNYLSKDKQFT